jgi:hypothetical protein
VSEGNLINILSNCKSVSGLIGELQSEPIVETLQLDCNSGSFNQKPIGLDPIESEQNKIIKIEIILN